MFLGNLFQKAPRDQGLGFQGRKEDNVFEPGVSDEKPLQRLADRGEARILQAEALQSFSDHAVILEQFIGRFQHRLLSRLTRWHTASIYFHLTPHTWHLRLERSERSHLFGLRCEVGQWPPNLRFQTKLPEIPAFERRPSGGIVPEPMAQAAARPEPVHQIYGAFLLLRRAVVNPPNTQSAFLLFILARHHFILLLRRLYSQPVWLRAVGAHVAIFGLREIDVEIGMEPGSDFISSFGFDADAGGWARRTSMAPRAGPSYLKMIADVYFEELRRDQLIAGDVLVKGKPDVRINPDSRGIEFKPGRRQHAAESGIFGIRLPSGVAPPVRPDELRQGRDLDRADAPVVKVGSGGGIDLGSRKITARVQDRQIRFRIGKPVPVPNDGNLPHVISARQQIRASRTDFNIRVKVWIFV